MIPINHKKYIIISYTNNKICNMIRKDSICYNINTDNECIVLKYYKKYNMKYGQHILIQRNLERITKHYVNYLQY